MRIASWNIMHGGSLKRLAGIMETLNRLDPDIIILTEYRKKPNVDLPSRLALAGWVHQQDSAPPPRVNGILIASRLPIEVLPLHSRAPMLAERWLEVSVPSHGVTLTAVHIPNYDDGRGKPDRERWGKEDFWRALLAVADQRIEQRHMIIGDFNTGQNDLDSEGSPFHQAEYGDRIRGHGWVDAWRSRYPDAREYTWYSAAGNGFRIDHAYLAPTLAPWLVNAFHGHEDRLQKRSDHAPLVVDLALTASQ